MTTIWKIVMTLMAGSILVLYSIGVTWVADNQGLCMFVGILIVVISTLIGFIIWG